eukprot:m.309302 g.309302  ORF g.309302 m.309302 type:complete len:181 (+) comp22826_c0_seq1:83-625(+)
MTADALEAALRQASTPTTRSRFTPTTRAGPSASSSTSSEKAPIASQTLSTAVHDTSGPPKAARRRLSWSDSDPHRDRASERPSSDIACCDPPAAAALPPAADSRRSSWGPSTRPSPLALPSTRRRRGSTPDSDLPMPSSPRSTTSDSGDSEVLTANDERPASPATPELKEEAQTWLKHAH